MQERKPCNALTTQNQTNVILHFFKQNFDGKLPESLDTRNIH